MATEQLKIGSKESADVKLRLLRENGENNGNPLYLHSQVLEKWEFFKVKLSERWSGNNRRPVEIEVTTSKDFDKYLKCIKMMYSSSAIGRCDWFCSVDECLAVLSVASEMLVDECIDECMRYLEAVRWTCEQESQIREGLSSLQLIGFPDLAARLRKQDEKELLNFEEQNIKAMLSVISDGNSEPSIREKMEKYIFSLEKNGYRGVADMCGRVIVSEIGANIRSVKAEIGANKSSSFSPCRDAFSAMLWLFRQIERYDGRTLEAALKTFSEDGQFARLMVSGGHMPDEVHHILTGFIKAIWNGRIIAKRSTRLSFLENWIPFMAAFARISNTAKLQELEKGIICVLETLPLADQNRIYHIWIDACKKNGARISVPFTWWSKQLQSHRHD